MRVFSVILFVIFLVFACSESSTNKDETLKVVSLTPVKNQTLYPIEKPDQINLVVTAKTNIEPDNETIIDWKVEKLKDDIDSSYVIEHKSNENLSTGFIIQKTDKKNEIILIIFEKGYYKVDFSISNFSNTDTITAYIKNGENLYKNLYLKLNTPEINKTTNTSKIKGYLSYNLIDSDNTSDIINTVRTYDLLNDWYDTKREVDITKDFQIITGLDYIEENIEDKTKSIKKVANLDSLITIENSNLFNDIIDISDKEDINILINNNNKLSNNIYLTLYSWFSEENVRKFKVENNTYTPESFPISLKQNKNAYISKYSIGYMQVYDNNIDSYASFTSTGLNSSIIDPKNKRIFPSLPYGYLLGKLGKDGSAFAIGSKFDYKSDNIKNIYFNTEKALIKIK